MKFIIFLVFICFLSFSLQNQVENEIYDFDMQITKLRLYISSNHVKVQNIIPSLKSLIIVEENFNPLNIQESISFSKYRLEFLEKEIKESIPMTTTLSKNIESFASHINIEESNESQLEKIYSLFLKSKALEKIASKQQSIISLLNDKFNKAQSNLKEIFNSYYPRLSSYSNYPPTSLFFGQSKPTGVSSLKKKGRKLRKRAK